MNSSIQGSRWFARVTATTALLCSFVITANSSFADEPAPAPKETSEETSAKPADAAAPSGEPAPQKGTELSPADEIQDLVYLGGKRPVFLRLRIRIGEKGFYSPLEEYARELFRELDENKDNSLDETEAKNLPGGRLIVAAMSNGTRADGKEIKADLSPADGKITPEELIAYVRAAVGNPFDIQTQQGESRQDIDLFGQLDGDGDGVIARSEIEEIQPIFRRLDLDDDGVLNRFELVGQREYQAMFTPQTTNSNSSAISNLPSVLQPIDRSVGPSKIVMRLVQRYDKLDKRPGSARFIRDNRLSADELGVEAETIKPYDKNSDGTLDSKELAKYLEDPRPEGELVVHFSERRTDDLKFQLLSGSAAPSDSEMAIRDEASDQLALVVTGIPMHLDATQGPTPIAGNAQTRQQNSQRFKQADQDNNGYLDMNEFRFIGLSTNLFTLIDADKDEQVFEKELNVYFNLQDGLSRSRINMTFRREGAKLYQSLDEDGDGRFSQSELQRAFEKILSWDEDGDGKIKLDELPSDYKVFFTIGPAPNPGNQNNLYANSVARAMMGSRQQAPPAGPTWFVKMDRNKDGSVSKREFLGPLEVFAKLDSSGDGLLDPTEARAVQAK